MNPSLSKFYFYLSFFFALICVFTTDGSAKLKDFSNPGASLNLADVIISGEKSDDRSAFTLAKAGDVDGDGLPDILIGAPNNDEGGKDAGKVYLFLGKNFKNLGFKINLMNADYQFIGERANDASGFSVAGAGDVDKDGLSDILIGAPSVHYFTDPKPSLGDGIAYHAQEGKAYLILGKNLGQPGKQNLVNADYKFIGENIDDQSGHSVANAGDVDADGKSDILIGAPRGIFSGQTVGKAYLILGKSLANNGLYSLSKSNGIFIGNQSLSGTGYSLCGDMNLDGDGKSDILIGAPLLDFSFNPGTAYLFLGSSLGNIANPTFINITKADYQFLGQNGSGKVGSSVANAGDLDGDGVDDILIGGFDNYQFGGHGAGYYSFNIIYQARVDVVLSSSLGAPGFLDLSKSDYKLVGELNNKTYVGAPYFAGNIFHNIFITGVADINAKDKPDILIGVPTDGSLAGITDRGHTYLLLGEILMKKAKGLYHLSQISNYIFSGERDGDLAGFGLASIGDIDQDGGNDILIGASGYNDMTQDEGSSYIIFGYPKPPLLDFSPLEPEPINVPNVDYSIPIRYIYRGCPDPPWPNIFDQDNFMNKYTIDSQEMIYSDATYDASFYLKSSSTTYSSSAADMNNYTIDSQETIYSDATYDASFYLKSSLTLYPSSADSSIAITNLSEYR